METKTAQTTPALALRPRDAAKALGISPRLLWQLTHDGTIPSIKLGRAVLYRRDALVAWLDGAEQKVVQDD